MVIELLPSTRDNLLRVALLEREGYGKKKNSIQISRLLCLRDAAAEFMACSTGVGRKHYQNVHPCAQPTVECTPRLHFMGHNVYLKSPGFGTFRHCLMCLEEERTRKLLPLRGLHSRHQPSQLSLPQTGMLPPQHTQREKRE